MASHRSLRRRGLLRSTACALTESMEPRLLLTLGKTSGDRVDSALQVLAFQPQFATNSVAADPGDLILRNAQGQVGVHITASDVAGLTPYLVGAGLQITSSRPDLHFVDGYISAAAIPQLEGFGPFGLLGVGPLLQAQTSAGLVVNQADALTQTERVRGMIPGLDGAGLTVGVLSDSFNILGGLSTDVTNGELPAGVNILKEGPAGSSDEGRGMAQLIHDLAPGAGLAFASAFFGEADFAQQIRDLADPAKGNADVIVDDISYIEEPMFQDGVISQAVDQVAAAGVPYFSSAGNQARESYERVAPGFSIDSLSGVTALDFDPGPGVDTRQSITVPNGDTLRMAMQWDDPFYTVNGVDTNLDIFLLNQGTNTAVAAGTDANVTTQVPSEFLGFTNNTGAAVTFEILIAHFAGPLPGRVKYRDFGTTVVTGAQFATSSPTAVGHAAAQGAVGVAAAPFFNQTVPESFTSAGPMTVLFSPNGTPLGSPDVRQAPQITALDGTNTSFFGSDSGADADTLPNFFGTSAAAPHAAAVAALMLDFDPSLTPAQVKQRLMDTALDIGAPGFDALTGAGLINASRAVLNTPLPATNPGTIVFSETFASGVLGPAWDVNTFSNGRYRVTGDVTASDAALVLDTQINGLTIGGNPVSSLNEAILHLDLAGRTNVNLGFRQREFNDEDNSMPATFTGSSNTDGVALSVDGLNWFRLIDLTGSNSTNTYQSQFFNLSTFAAANGLTLGNDVRIKFQQFGRFTAEGGHGFAFDDVGVIADAQAVGEPPAIINFGGDVAFTENAARIIISSTAEVTDADTTNFAGGQVRVESLGGFGGDLLQIVNQGTGAGQIGLSGLNVTFEGAVIGTRSGGTNAPLVIDLAGTVSPAAVQALLRQLTFRETSENPTLFGLAPSRFIQLTLEDETGNVSFPAAKTVNITAINDRPVLGGLAGSASYTENDAPLLFAPGATAGDPDSADFAGGVLTVTIGSRQTGDALGIAAQGDGTDEINVAGNNVSYEGTVIGSFSGGTGAAPLTVTFNGAALSHMIQALLRRLTFVNTTENPTATTRSIQFKLTDGDGGTSAVVTRPITVASPNDQPVLGAIPSPQGYVENAAPKVLAPQATVADVDSANFDAGKLTVKSTAGGLGSDRLTIRNQGTGAGQVGVSGDVVSVGGVAVGTFVGGSGLQPLVITFNAESKLLRVQAVLRNIQYQNITDNPTNFGANPSRTVNYALTDGDGGAGAAFNQTLNITATNDASLVGNFTDASTYTVGAGATILDANATLTDPDSADFAGGNLVLQFTAGGIGSNRLEIRNEGTAAGQIGVSGSNVTFGGTVIGTLNANGGVGLTALMVTFTSAATPTAAQALLRNLTYRSTIANPTGPKTLTLKVRDGDGGLTTVNKTLNIAAALVAPARASAAFAAYAEWERAV